MAGTRRDKLTTGREPKVRVPAIPTALPADSPLADFDTQLMLQVAAGSREAGSTLIRRNGRQIARYLSRLVRDRWAVEDLTHDVFLNALSHADQYRPTAKVTTWLYRIATNTALNYLKQSSRRQTRPEPPDGPLDIVDRSAATPERRINQDELRQHVSRAIVELPINQRVALTLFQYEEFSYEQIATVLDVSVEAVRCLLSRARATLRRQLRAFE